MDTKSTGLVRALGLRDSLAIVIGSMIGTGIFLKTTSMVQEVGAMHWVLLAWFVAGVLSLLGAFTYSELGAMFPEAGGTYVYLREGYGPLPAFLSGWVSFLVISPGSIAAYAVASVTFLNGYEWIREHQSFVVIGLIGGFSLLNGLAVSFGGRVQSFFTGLKIAMVLLIALAIFYHVPSQESFLFSKSQSGGVLTWSGFGMATLAALWAYDGWDAIARVGGEILRPQRTLPLALIFGILTVFGLYALINVAYFWALPLSEIQNANSSLYPEALPVATKAVMSFMGDSGVQILSFVFLISTLGAMNGSILTSARVPYAMAKDQLFIRFLAKLSPHTHVPVRAIWFQSGLAMVMALSGTFDQLTNYVVFSAWIFYGFTGITLFVFRKKKPDLKRDFKVPGYPLVPALFVGMSLLLVINTLMESPFESFIGLCFLLSGIPAYFFFKPKIEV
ncbi:MAG TPA: hypothetical protein DCL41_02700 [Bdellovibrionales bacterium]|nr:hypothetical protein [Pseudobdellovibrionaceae bacterium]HAG90750.1 hypothetical protein [Bdellovibrionales bacterium]|tara:strand:- start:18272 stop:19615 length:1344 start_codon:yes stop_codon:yes gene_type:complete